MIQTALSSATAQGWPSHDSSAIKTSQFVQGAPRSFKIYVATGARSALVQPQLRQRGNIFPPSRPAALPGLASTLSPQTPQPWQQQELQQPLGLGRQGLIPS